MNEKPHYRLHCKLLPFIPRYGWTVIGWRVGDYGAWFQDCRKAVAVLTTPRRHVDFDLSKVLP